jgi:NAD(P)-dependent dehydrogenase (short-subunit alcohol dehydrogenase family)
VEVVVCDLASQASIRLAAKVIDSRFGSLTGLLNCAGVTVQERLETEDGFEMTFGVDYLGHFLLTNLLVDALHAGAPARVVIVSGEGHRGARSLGETINFDDLNGAQSFMVRRAVQQSLLAKIAFTYELARRTAYLGIGAIVTCPGLLEVDTGPFSRWYTRYYTGAQSGLLNPQTPEEAAANLVYLLADPAMDGVTSKYFIRRELALSSPESYDRFIAERLWRVSEGYVGQRFEYLDPMFN